MNDHIIVKDNKIILSSEIIDALNANSGDRIVIEYTEYENTILPIILISDGGNKLTKSNTVSFRGKANNNLSAYGTKFDYFQKDGIIYLIGDDPKYKIFTDVKTAIKHIDKEIIEDNRFDIKFDFEL